MRIEALRLQYAGKNPYEEHVLNYINFSVCKADFHCLLIPDSRSRALILKILQGVISPESGAFRVNDKPVVKKSDLSKIGCIADKTSLVSHMSIAKNIFLTDKRFYKFGFTQSKKMFDTAELVLNEAGITHMNAAQPAGMLTPCETRIVEIAGKVTKGAEIIYLDNITEQYTDHETNDLYLFIKHLNETGITVISAVQKYNELCDHATGTTLIDNGSTVVTLASPKNRREQLIRYLNVPETSVPAHRQNDSPEHVLRFLVGGVEISVRRGETTALYDEDLSLTKKLRDGAIVKDVAVIRNARAFHQIFPNMSLARNITIKMGSPLYNRFGLRSPAVEKYSAARVLKVLDGASLIQKYGKLKALPHLPRHEQMKIIVARWLCLRPSVFLFVEPLISYDDTTVHEFHQMLALLEKLQCGVLVVSSSYSELRRITDIVDKI